MLHMQIFACCSAAFGKNDICTAEKRMLQCNFCSATFRKLQCNFCFRLWHVAGVGFRWVGSICGLQTHPNLHSPARGYKFGCVCSYIAGITQVWDYKFGCVWSETLRPTQTGLCKLRWVWSSVSLGLAEFCRHSFVQIVHIKNREQTFKVELWMRPMQHVADLALLHWIKATHVALCLESQIAGDFKSPKIERRCSCGFAERSAILIQGEIIHPPLPPCQARRHLTRGEGSGCIFWGTTED